MFCSECGTSLSSGEIYCSKCGTKTGTPDSNQSASAEIQEVITSGPVKKQTQELSRRGKIICLLGVLGVVTISVLYLQYMNSTEYLIKSFDAEQEKVHENERQTQLEQNQQQSQQSSETQEIDTPPPQASSHSPSDVALAYANNLAQQLERSGNPGCQALASSIRMVGYSGNPPDIKMRQVDAIVDKAPGVCFY